VIITIFSFSSIGWSTCEGDLNCDGDTDGSDLALFANDFGTTGCGTCDDVISEINALKDRIAVLENLLAGAIRNGNTIQFRGVNLQIVNSMGNTNTTNGLGNLIVGYNEEHTYGNNRDGSHNLVVGKLHGYSSYGGIVGGENNRIQAPYASVTGGTANWANGDYSHVSGGLRNKADGWGSSVSAGTDNTASGNQSSVTGGIYNTASGHFSTVAGGGGSTLEEGNEAYAYYSAILGGSQNTTGEPASEDRTVGEKSTVSGGYKNSATGEYASVSGGGGNMASFHTASVSGGQYNVASGWASSSSGGVLNTAIGAYASVSGGRNNEAIGSASSVTGGGGVDSNVGNTAHGDYSSVNGGLNNTAHGNNSSVSGGVGNTAYYTGQSKTGARPDYDSGWVAFNGLDSRTLYHNLGGNPDNYIVDMQTYGSLIGRNIYGYGHWFDADKHYGCFWKGLTENSIEVLRNGDASIDEVRIRIWNYN
jgi:hypothetical protein